MLVSCDCTTNYHKYGTFKPQKFILLQFWSLEVWNQGVSRAMLPPKGLEENSSCLLSFWWRIGKGNWNIYCLKLGEIKAWRAGLHTVMSVYLHSTWGETKEGSSLNRFLSFSGGGWGVGRGSGRLLVFLYIYSPLHLNFLFSNWCSGSGTRAITVGPGSRIKQGWSLSKKLEVYLYIFTSEFPKASRVSCAFTSSDGQWVQLCCPVVEIAY